MTHRKRIIDLVAAALARADSLTSGCVHPEEAALKLLDKPFAADLERAIENEILDEAAQAARKVGQLGSDDLMCAAGGPNNFWYVADQCADAVLKLKERS